MTYELVKVTTDEDWKTYDRIREEQLFIARGRPPGTYTRRHAHELLPENTPLLLKKDGIGVATTRFDIMPKLGPGIAAIRLVAVDDHLQGQGIGRILAEKTIAFAKQKGIRRIVVNADDAAIGYYKRFGYRIEMWDEAELKNPTAANCTQMVLDIA